MMMMMNYFGTTTNLTGFPGTPMPVYARNVTKHKSLFGVHT
jgi:hypothetical protein